MPMQLESSCYCSVAKSCPAPWTAARQSFPVLHYLLEFAETHVHRDGNAVQPSLPLSPPSPFALSPSQIQGLFQ